MRFLKRPQHKAKNPIISWEQSLFTQLFRGIPASTIPANGVAEAKNVLLYGPRFRVRPGTELLNYDSQHELPHIPGRNDYEATKTGTLITATVGDNFSSADVGRFFVWPDGTNELITGYVAVDMVRVHSSDPHQPCTAGSPGRVRGRVNQLWDFKKDRRIFMHIDTRVFWTDYGLNVAGLAGMHEWIEVINKSANAPAEEKSIIREQKNNLYLFTTNGLFKIDTTSYDDTVDNEYPMEMFCINTAIPDNTVCVQPDWNAIVPDCFSEDWNSYHKFGRKYLFSMCKVKGLLTQDRNTGFIQKETGTNSYPAPDFVDWKDAYRPTPFCSSTGDLTGFYTTILPGWVRQPIEIFQRITPGFLGIGSLSVTVDGVTSDILMDFITCQKWEDVAAKIQESLRKVFTAHDDLVCSYDSVNDRFIMLPGSSLYAINTVTHGTTVGSFDLYFNVYLNFNGTVYAEAATILGGGVASGDPQQALAIPPGQRGWTHYGLYSTLEKDSQSGVQDDNLFVWQKDVPVAAAFIVDIVWDLVTVTHGAFQEHDLGSILKIGHHGDEIQFTRYNSTVNMLAQASTLMYNGVSACIGGGNVMACYSVGHTVFRVSGDTFAAGDVGETMYWSDGSITTIESVTNANEAVMCEHLTDKGNIADPLAMTWAPVSRNYADIFDDNTLDDRVDDFSLQQRLRDALPSGNLGAIVPGFLVTATAEDTEFFYSPIPDKYGYLTGHYDPEFQRNTVPDVIRALEYFPNLLIIYNAKSTWRCQTNIADFYDNPKTGKSTALLSGLGVIDGGIGIQDRTGIVNIGSAEQAVITHEPGVRIFNGYQYGADLTVDESGRDLIKCELQKSRKAFCLAYEPSLYGLMLYCTENLKYNSADEEIEDSNVVITDKCWRLALKPEQGFSFSELYGDFWVFPETGVNFLNIIDSHGIPVTVVMDFTSGRPYILRVRNTPGGGKPVYVDKYSPGDSYHPGSEIPWLVKFKEHIGTEERFLLNFLELHNFFRPEDEANQGATGYDSSGFRTSQEISVKAFIDGNLTELTKSTKIPNNGLVTYTKPIQARRIQHQIEGTCSEIQGVKSRAEYEVLVSRDAPDLHQTSEKIIQSVMGSPHFRLSRGRYRGYNLANGGLPDIGTFATACVTGIGPDGKSDSGFQAGNGVDRQLVFSDAVSLTSDFTLIFGLRHQADAAQMMFSFGGARMDKAAGVLVYNDPSGSYPINYTSSVGSWDLFMLKRVADLMYVFRNGYALTSFTLASIESLIGNFTLLGVNPGLVYPYLFDIILFDSALSDDTAEYYNRDVVDQNGVSLLPIA